MEWGKRCVVSDRAIERGRLFTEFEEGRLSRKQVAEGLGLSERQVSRLMKKFAHKSIQGLDHGNFGKPSPRKTSPEICSRVLELAQGKYSHFNSKHFHEMLQSHEQIQLSYSSVKRLVQNLKGVSSRRRSQHRKFRSRYPTVGLMLQMDGSEHAWVKGKSWCLIAGIDDATSFVPYGEFFETEGLEGYLRVIRRTLELWGVPVVVYVDHASWLSGTTKDPERGQFARICKELGIQILFANSPQAKGRIERLWRTFQDRLIAEFHFHKVNSLQNATDYLNREFLPKTWNQRFTVEPKSGSTSLRAAPPPTALDEIFTYRYSRKARNDQTILWGNRMFQIHSSFSHSLAKKEIEIRIYPDGRMGAFYLGKKLEISLVERTEDRVRKTTPQPLAQGLVTHLQALESVSCLINSKT